MGILGWRFGEDAFAALRFRDRLHIYRLATARKVSPGTGNAGGGAARDDGLSRFGVRQHWELHRPVSPDVRDDAECLRQIVRRVEVGCPDSMID